MSSLNRRFILPIITKSGSLLLVLLIVARNSPGAPAARHPGVGHPWGTPGGGTPSGYTYSSKN